MSEGCLESRVFGDFQRTGYHNTLVTIMPQILNSDIHADNEGKGLPLIARRNGIDLSQRSRVLPHSLVISVHATHQVKARLYRNPKGVV